tara:strand:+ start:1165 stop:1881 length:717 start_codon:yes stop_codon:yes gene_type:complete
MPTITLPNTFSDTAPNNVTDASLIAENFYEPNTTPDSLEVINGQLQQANRASGWDIEKELIQPGSLSGGQSVGATLPLDYFGTQDEHTATSAGFVFSDWSSTPAAKDAANLYRAIPGGSITFYLPYTPSIFMAHWQILVAHTGVQAAGTREHTLLKLFVGDAPAANQIRTMFPAGTTWAAAPDQTNRSGRDFDRTWPGHYWDDGSNLTKGWNRLSLRIATNTSIARVFCRGLNFVYFK